jgi:ribose 5-phosphate isomerase B
MTANNRIVLSNDHAAIQLRQTIAAYITAHGWVAVDIGPTTPESTHYPKHGEAAARLVASVADLVSSYAAQDTAS